MPDFVKNNVLLIAISVVTVLSTALYGFTDFLRVGFVFADAGVGIVLMTLGAFWIGGAVMIIRRASDKYEGTSFLGGWHILDDKQRGTVLTHSVVGLAVLISAFFVLPMPLTALAAKGWEVCGELQGACKPADCLTLYDSRGRALGIGCQPIDASGFFRVVSGASLTYPPRSARLACPDGAYFAPLELVTNPAEQCDRAIQMRKAE